MQKGGGVKSTGIGKTGMLPSGASSGGGGQYPFLPGGNKNGVSSSTSITPNPVLPASTPKSPLKKK